MPVQTRSKIKAETIRRDEQSAVDGLIQLTLIDTDNITPPTTPVDKNIVNPPSLPKRCRNMYVDTSVPEVVRSSSPPVLNHVINTNNSQSVLSNLKHSTQRLVALIDEIEQEHYKLKMEELDYVTSVLE